MNKPNIEHKRFKTLHGSIDFSENIVAFDEVNGQLFITTETMMFRLEQEGSDFKPIRTW